MHGVSLPQAGANGQDPSPSTIAYLPAGRVESAVEGSWPTPARISEAMRQKYQESLKSFSWVTFIMINSEIRHQLDIS